MSLSSFGFTPTEGKVYEALLRLGPATGYAVARAAGIARANAYQSLDGLVRRGAARRSATIPARYAAASPEALVDALERRSRRDLADLQEHLAGLPVGVSPDDLAVTTHGSWEDLVAAAAAAVADATDEVLAIGGSWARSLERPLTAAKRRRVAVRVVWLDHPAPAVAALREVPLAELIEYWSGLPLAVVADRGLALCGVQREDRSGGGIESSHEAVVPFLRHLLRREIAGPDTTASQS